MKRSLLFLPGNSPKMVMNGMWLNADSIIFDLEDSVSVDEKDAARILVREAFQNLNFRKKDLIVRINALSTPYWEKDIEEMMPLEPAMLLLPKAEGIQSITTVTDKMKQVEHKYGLTSGKVKVGAQIETALGVEKAFEIAGSDERVTSLFLGAEDLSADLRSHRTKEGSEINYARGRVVNAARACEKDVFDTPFTDVNDLEGLRADALFARDLGFSGKLVISPRHLEIVNDVFTPTAEEIANARNILMAVEEGKKNGKGAVSLNGKMIDAPVQKRAEIILQIAQEIEEGIKDYE